MNVNIADKVNFNISFGQKQTRKQNQNKKLSVKNVSNSNLKLLDQNEQSSITVIKKRSSISLVANKLQQNKPFSIPQNSLDINNNISTVSKYKKKSLIQFLLNSKYLKQSFSYFCNLSNANTRKKTFDEILNQKDIMSLNKFMLFCKEYKIDQIFQLEMKNNSSNYPEEISSFNQTHKNQNQIVTIKANIKDNKPLDQSSMKKNKKKLLQIPVKSINRVQTYLAKIYKKSIGKGQKMNYQQFVKCMVSVFELFKKNFKEFYDGKNVDYKNQTQIQEKFITDVLYVKGQQKHRQKMQNFSIQIKGSISYHHQPHRKSQNYLKKPLVLHGGRMQNQIKNQLTLFHVSKVKKTQSWISTQPQMIGIYSKSRVFYKPNPSKIYQTNDVIRLARDETGQNQTQSLFDWPKQHQQQQKLKHKTLHQNHNKSQKKNNQNIISFSKIFEDKTNNFTQKIQKVRQQYKKNGNLSRIKKKQSTVNDDQILKQYFLNEKLTYGDENHNIVLNKQQQKVL